MHPIDTNVVIPCCRHFIAPRLPIVDCTPSRRWAADDGGRLGSALVTLDRCRAIKYQYIFAVRCLPCFPAWTGSTSSATNDATTGSTYASRQNRHSSQAIRSCLVCYLVAMIPRCQSRCSFSIVRPFVIANYGNCPSLLYLLTTSWLLCHRLFLDSLSTCYSGIYPQAHPHLLHSDSTRLVSARQPASHVDCFRIDPSPQATGDRQAPQSNHTCDSPSSKSLCGLEYWVPESQRQILTQSVSVMIQLPSVRTLLLEDSTSILRFRLETLTEHFRGAYVSLTCSCMHSMLRLASTFWATRVHEYKPMRARANFHMLYACTRDSMYTV